jgi:hypothetical protein
MASSIHAERVDGRRASTGAWGGRVGVRLAGLAAAACGLAALGLAGGLTPNPQGYGTHEQLGVPGCSFMARTGYPCPTCGLTTSVAAAVRGQLGLAWRAQPFGLVVAAALAALAAAGTAQLACGRDVVGRLRPRLWWLWAAVGGVLAGWTWVLVDGTLAGRWGL